MSKYTTEVRFICETEAGLMESKGFNDIETILNVSAPKIFNFPFPIFDEEYRLVLEKNILRHYYTREIGMETVGAWKLKLQDKLNLIMPYYNKLYESANLEFNPLYDTDITTEKSVSNTGTNQKTTNNTRRNQDNTTGNYRDTTAGNYTDNSTRNRDTDETHSDNDTHSDTRTGTNTNTRWDLYSDTPQGGIQGIANAEDPSLANNGYLTNARKITDNGGDSDTSSGTRGNTGAVNVDETITGNNSGSNNVVKEGNTTANTNQTITDNGTGTETIDTLETFLERKYGKRGAVSYSKLLQEYRATFLNIDLLIINELSDLFFGLWE